MGNSLGKESTRDFPTSFMKVAIVHELLTMKGGAENVVRAFAEMFPEAPIYTLLYNERAVGDWFPRNRVRSSSLQPIASLTRQFNHHLYLPFFKRAVEALDCGDADVVLSSSSAFAHGVRVPPGATHISYIHSPARYLWDQTHAVLHRTPGILRPCIRRLFHRLRVWDAEAATRAHVLVAASRLVQRRIQLYWDRDSAVVHPFADDFWFAEAPRTAMQKSAPFLVVANLRRYKNITAAIDACAKANVPLIIAGDGPMRAELERRAHGHDVRFVGRVEQAELRELYRSARALLIPGIEDFGINAVEALACGTPVICPAEAGTAELIDEGVTGILARDISVDALADALRSASLDQCSSNACRTTAERCTKARFEQQMYSIIEATFSARGKDSRTA